MIRKGFKINYLQLKTYASMKVEASSEPVQEYDVISGEFYPDRTLVPLVLTPIIGYTDPNTNTDVPNAAAQLTDGHWYRLDNLSGGKCEAATEIYSGSKYSIDTSVGSPTYGLIVIKENIQPGNPVTFVFRATLAHPKGDVVMKEISWQARSKSVENLPVLTLDNASETRYNPWEDTDLFTLTPALIPAVSGAVFAWETLNNSVWGAVDSTHYDFGISISGNAITIKRSQMPDRIDLRCKATYTKGGKTHTDTVYASVVRLLPHFEYDIINLAGIRETDSSVAPMAKITTAKGVITDPKGEVTVKWYNSADSLVAQGVNPVIPLSSIGSNLELGLDIQDAGGWKCIELSNGDWLVDASGNTIITR